LTFFSSNELAEFKFKGNSICHFEILRSEVNKNNYERLNRFFQKVYPYALTARQKVLFSFAGYDDDDRELSYIPEVVSYIKKLLRLYPYFWYYAIPLNSEIFFFAALMDERNSTLVKLDNKQKVYMQQDTKELQRFFTIMGYNLDIFGDEIKDINGAAESFKIWGKYVLNDMN